MNKTIREGWPPFEVWHRCRKIRRGMNDTALAIQDMTAAFRAFTESMREVESALSIFVKQFQK